MESTPGQGDPAETTAAGAKVAVLVPCHNEAGTIARVVADFRRHLPHAEIHVCDNASTDDTARVARACGARLHTEPLRGKGNAVRRMLADIEADIYLLVDGDGTYDASAAPALVDHLARGGFDMVNCARLAADPGAYRPMHQFGNRLLTGLVASVFGRRLTDMLSGYRAMSRRFVKTFPALSSGFEIETELTVHALELRAPIAEVDAPYFERPRGSASKLHTVRDGVRILRVIVHLVKEERPLPFFTFFCLLLALLSLVLGLPVVAEFHRTGLVGRLPTAVLAMGLMILAFLSLVCGLVLDTVTRGRREFKRLSYLAAAPRARAPGAPRARGTGADDDPDDLASG